MDIYEVVFWVIVIPNSFLVLIWALMKIKSKHYAVTYEYRGEQGKIFREMAVVNTVLGQNPEVRAKSKLPVKIKIFDPDFSGFEIVEIRKIEVL